MSDQPDTPPAVPTDDRYSEAMRRFSGDLRMTKQVWQSMADRGVEQQPHHWSLYLDAHLVNNDLDGANQVLSSMREAGIDTPSDMAWRIALSAVRSGRKAAAVEMLDELRSSGAQPPDELLTAVFSTEIALRRLPAARALLRRMAHAGLAGTAAEYQVLADDIIERRAINDAETMVMAMLAGQRPPGSELAGSLVAMMARGGHVERAEQLLATFDEADVAVAVDGRSAIVNAHAKSKDLDATRRALRDLDAHGPGANSHQRNVVLAAIIEKGKTNEAWAEAMRLVAADAIPSGANLDGLVRLDIASGKLRRALGGLDWMLMLGVPPPANRVADLVGRFLKTDLDAALAIYKEFTSYGVPADRRRGGQLVEALVDAKRLDEARTLLRQLAKGKVLTKGRHWSPLLAALARAKRHDDVRALIDEMLASGVRPTSKDAEGILLSTLRPRNPQPAWELLLRLQEQGLQLDERTWREFLWAFARLGRGEATREVYVRMAAAGIAMQDRHQKALDWATGETARRIEDAPDADQGDEDDVMESGSSLEPEDVTAEADAAEQQAAADAKAATAAKEQAAADAKAAEEQAASAPVATGDAPVAEEATAEAPVAAPESQEAADGTPSPAPAAPVASTEPDTAEEVADEPAAPPAAPAPAPEPVADEPPTAADDEAPAAEEDELPAAADELPAAAEDDAPATDEDDAVTGGGDA